MRRGYVGGRLGLLLGLGLLAVVIANPVRFALQNFMLPHGTVQRGHLVVIGAQVYLAPGSELTGSLLVVGSNLIVAGEVGGHVVFVGQNLDLNHADVGGWVFPLGAQVRAVSNPNY
jgi:hypothetical protein